MVKHQVQISHLLHHCRQKAGLACHVLRALKALSSPKHISARVPLGNRQCWRNTFLSRSGWLAPKVPLQIRIGC
jgi:hypothetical protein